MAEPVYFDMLQNVNDRNGYLGLGLLMVLVFVQYLVRHMISINGKRVEDQPDAISDWKMRTRRFTDTMYVVAILFFGIAWLSKVKKDGISTLRKGILYGVFGAFFLCTTSALGRLVGAPLGFGECTSNPCNGLQDWIVFLVISFILFFSMRKNEPTAIIAVLSILVVVSATVTAWGGNPWRDNKKGELKDVNITDFAFEIFKGILMAFIIVHLYHNRPKKGDDNTLPSGRGFGEDASSIF